VLDCLQDLSSNGERFQQLQEQGKRRLKLRTERLQKTLAELDTEESDLNGRIESRIEELTATRNPAVRESIEKSILDLEGNRKELGEKRQLVRHSIDGYRAIAPNGKDFYQDYSDWITEVLGEPRERQKDGLQGLIASLTLEETKMKLALFGVNRKEPVRPLIVPAPPIGRVSNLLL